MEKYAVFVASMPGANISAKLVPLKARRDVPAEIEQRSTTLKTLAKV
jgi:hypothetical protein